MPSPSVSRSSGFVPRATSSPSFRPSPSVSAFRRSVPSWYSCRFVRPSRSKSSIASTGLFGFSPRLNSTSSGMPSPSVSVAGQRDPDGDHARRALVRRLDEDGAAADGLHEPIAGDGRDRRVADGVGRDRCWRGHVLRAVRPDSARSPSAARCRRSCVSVVVGAATVSAVGIGVVWPKMIRGMLTTPLAGTMNGSDSPEMVWPLTMQVDARADGTEVGRHVGQDPRAVGVCADGAVEDADGAVLGRPAEPRLRAPRWQKEQRRAAQSAPRTRRRHLAVVEAH